MSKRARMAAALTALARPVYAKDAGAYLHWHPEAARDVLRSMARDGKCAGWQDERGRWRADRQKAYPSSPAPQRRPAQRNLRRVQDRALCAATGVARLSHPPPPGHPDPARGGGARLALEGAMIWNGFLWGLGFVLALIAVKIVAVLMAVAGRAIQRKADPLGTALREYGEALTRRRD